MSPDRREQLITQAIACLADPTDLREKLTGPLAEHLTNGATALGLEPDRSARGRYAASECADRLLRQATPLQAVALTRPADLETLQETGLEDLLAAAFSSQLYLTIALPERLARVSEGLAQLDLETEAAETASADQVEARLRDLARDLPPPPLETFLTASMPSHAPPSSGLTACAESQCLLGGSN